MEIDLFTIIMGLVFLVAIIGPIVYFNRLGKNRTRRLEKLLHDAEQRHGLQFGEYETWNDKAIGLDAKKGKLFFVDLAAKNQTSTLDVTKVKKCQAFHSKDMVQLIIEKRDHASELPAVLVLFDNKVDDPLELGFHRVRADKWARLINQSALPERRKPRKVA